MQNEIVTTAGSYHVPALLKESVDGLNVRPNGTYVDVTFGGGGHSREIMRRLGKEGHLLAFDQDMDAYVNKIEDARFIFVHSNFRYLRNFLHYYGVEKIDGLLADLGVSSHHFDDESRGFSFRFDGELDMRMNRNAALKASDVLNDYTESKLADIFYVYGEMRNARLIARAIVKERMVAPINTVQRFLDVLKPFVGKDKEKKDLARIFQALRIEVNDEMDTLRKLLYDAVKVLKPGGRIAILTYHSLEDRIVKNFFKTGNFEGKLEKDFYGNPIVPLRLVNNKVIVASDEEVEANPRARSAKLRIAEKI
ncbi:MAG: 16S rRNA (cytosine(1402)-N(4))-methyltransferase RsmH [Bacteroidetes bacterium]|uniref:Ribosomal RNA small subunit methyltransferase H n=1 Tax=Candidatus Gallipaludibacter merdavium TaxID=2840839 RepID=A0A9D9N4H4_9BACT|nr:16S rRNA (cytosine(1402)-N(4))-methyltransferase RsmH [Candidatus Gallipaludibacter merdavium]